MKTGRREGVTNIVSLESRVEVAKGVGQAGLAEQLIATMGKWPGFEEDRVDERVVECETMTATGYAKKNDEIEEAVLLDARAHVGVR